MKRWTQIFKALSNINRVRIVKMLSGRGQMSVSEIAEELDISPKATSKHLIILHNLDVLSNKGRHNRVEYWLNPALPVDLKKTIKLFI
ncbi:MAG: metalloregulator ArsR/SmtB family transcription factor [Candidatus Sungiibacteriota bacterium]